MGLDEVVLCFLKFYVFIGRGLGVWALVRGARGIAGVRGVQPYPMKELWGSLFPLALELEGKQLPVSHTRVVR